MGAKHCKFEKLDLDGSGKVDSNEVMNFMHRCLGFDVCEKETSFARMVIAAGGDTNNDGKISFEEIQRTGLV